MSVPALLQSAPLPTLPGPSDLIEAFLSARNPRTVRAYARDLDDFARFLGQPSAGTAVELFLAGGPGQANAAALAYKAHLIARQLAPATIARRLAALRSMVRLARQLGRVTWLLEIPGPRSEAYRDTAGPGESGWKTTLERAKTEAAGGTAIAVRNLALVRLLHDLGLRRSEVAELELEHYDPARGTVDVLGKGKLERIRLSVPGPVRTALDSWIRIRGLDPGPLFHRLDRAGSRSIGLTAEGIYHVVGQLGRRAGLSRRLRPHGLRHAAITAVLDRSQGNVRAAQRFSRHANLQTLVRYDDNRTDLGGQMAALISMD
jgi:integrase/recombinase XerC